MAEELHETDKTLFIHRSSQLNDNSCQHGMAVGQTQWNTLVPQNIFLVICIVIMNVMWFNASFLRTAPTMCREHGLLVFFFLGTLYRLPKLVLLVNSE